MLRGWHPPCILIVALALAALPWSASTALAATREEIPIQVAGIFANGMVLQRGMPVPVWGWASPGRTVEVAFAGQTKKAVADASGLWKVGLNPLATNASGRDLTVTDQTTGNQLVVADVLVGEVWFSAGQSNMMMGLASAAGGKEFFEATQPELGDQVRVVHGMGPDLHADTPRSDLRVVWKKPAAGYSAVSYWFAAKLRRHFGGAVPIGMVTFLDIVPAEAWIDRGTLEADPRLAPVLEDALAFDAKSYNGVIAPVAPFAIRGVLYYQGEYNGGRGIQFRTMMPALIETWRRAWRRPDLPFLFVQLPGFIAQQAPPSAIDMDPATLAAYRLASGRTTWTDLRDAQLHTWQTVPHTGMAVTIDVGEPYDIHPPRKEPVAERLFLLARKVAYGEDLVASGPAPASIKPEAGGFSVMFTNVGSGLAGRGGGIQGFEVAGEDLVFHPAEAEVRDDSLFVRSASVPIARHLRYAWAGDPKATLINAEGLPASPFRWSDPDHSPQPGSASFAFPNAEFEETQRDGSLTAWRCGPGTVRRVEATTGEAYVVLTEPNKSGLFIENLAYGTGGFWNTPPLEAAAVRPGSLVTYGCRIASPAGAEQSLYANLCHDASGGGYQTWGGTRVLSTASREFVPRTVVQRMTDTIPDSLRSAAPTAGARFIHHGSAAPGPLLLDSLSDVTIIRPQLSVSSTQPIDFGSVARGETVESPAITITNGQTATARQVLTDGDPGTEFATVLYGAASFAPDGTGLLQKVTSATDGVGAIIIGPDAAQFELVTDDPEASPRGLRLIGQDGEPGLSGGPRPESETFRLRFLGGPEPATFSATLRIVTQAGNLGRLSQGETGEPPSHLYYRDIPLSATVAAGQASATDGLADFFTARVEPLLRERCFDCHSHDTEIRGGLALDVRSGWEQGGQSGPAVVPGDPEASLLITAVKHGIDGQTMPPDDPLTPDEIATLVEWVKRGAPDPRRTTAGEAWEKVYTRRLGWWSLQPVTRPEVPDVADPAWARSPLDRFILDRLDQAGLAPAPPADPHRLVSRLAFTLTGLPPTPDEMETFLHERRPDAYERLVDHFLASPHFGERWARHWMDVVHYADSHGYEWDVPAKHAWRYRDYLVRAFNADVPFDRLILEHLAGDLISPRIDPGTGANEALIGTMGLRMGERWHGDNAAAEATSAQNLGDTVDTATKAFLATTVGCARCHDHKLDAISQADYYAFYGTLMSSRWGVRSIDTADPNVGVIEELQRTKRLIRERLASHWQTSHPRLLERLLAAAAAAAATPAPAAESAFPESLAAALTWPADRLCPPNTFTAERKRRVAANAATLTLLADFTAADTPTNGWQWEGFGMQHGLVADGEPVIADEGDAALLHLLPAGRWSHVYSPRLGGAIRSPELFHDPPLTFSVGYGGGRKASHTLIVDRAVHSERVAYAEQSPGSWLSFTAGSFKRLAGSDDTATRRVYLELATKAYDNYFPPRTNYPGFKVADEHDPRSWFGVTRVYAHPAGTRPVDELGRLVGMLDRPLAGDSIATRVADRILSAIDRWAEQRCDGDDVAVINEALAAGWLDNSTETDPEVARLVAQYRDVERRLQPDQTIGGLDDWREAADAAVAVRGEPGHAGAVVPRGTIRFLEDLATRPDTRGSGRLEVARSLAHVRNPLTARVFVNRVWLHLFGDGLVRTPDDFGHLGEHPSHPQLLDFLASRFMEEGWSLKKLVREIVMSATWSQASEPATEAVALDPENRLLHHWPRRRLEAEAIRDAMLSVAGRLDPTLGGEPVQPSRVKEDAAKRLFSGPLDGDGRRSLYLRMTLMEPPRFLALFNQPIPQMTVGKRDRSTVPEQALALLNDPFVRSMADAWGTRQRHACGDDLATGASAMLMAGLGRPGSAVEVKQLLEVARACSQARAAASEQPQDPAAEWRDMAHTIFLMPEFSHVE